MAYQTFDELKKSVGRTLLLWDGTDWLTGRDVTEADIGEYLNEIYLDDLFPKLAVNYPEYFRQVALANSAVATGTAGAALTGNTIVATTSIFNNSMVGRVIVNDTDGTSTIISGFTNATTVTVEEEDVSDWSGDTISVIGNEFAIGGDGTDIYTVEQIAVQYDDADTYKRVAEPRNKTDIFQQGSETGSQLRPLYYMTTATVSGVPTDAIGIFPQFDKNVTNAIEMTYIARPAKMSADTDKPRFPIGSALIYGAIMRSYETMQDLQKTGYWQNKYEMARRKAISNFRFKQSNKIRPQRRQSYIHNRLI